MANGNQSDVLESGFSRGAEDGLLTRAGGDFIEVSERALVVDSSERIIEFPFSSETPYKRAAKDGGQYYEVLSHDDGGPDFSRLNTEAPLCFNHNRDVHLGRILKAWVQDRRGWVRVQFSKSEDAVTAKCWKDVQDGVLRAVSPGYSQGVGKQIGVQSGIKILQFVGWMTYEVSLVTVPADVTVGIGRTAGQCETNTEGERKYMPVAAEETREEMRKRYTEIRKVCNDYGMRDLAEKCIDEDLSVQETQVKILEAMGKARQVRGTDGMIEGLKQSDIARYSIVRAARQLMHGGAVDGLERELSDEYQKKNPDVSVTRGFFVPDEIFYGKRAMSVTGGDPAGSEGGAGVFTSYAGTVELLREATVLSKLGARTISGLRGDVSFVRLSGEVVSYYVGESGEATGSSLKASVESVTPRSVRNYVPITDQLLLQSTPDVERYVREEMISSITLGVEDEAINGPGTVNHMKGILHADNHVEMYAGGTRELGAAAVGTNANGANITYADALFMSAAARKRKTRSGAFGFLTNADVQTSLMLTQRFAGTDSPVWVADGSDPDMGRIAGIRAVVSQLVPSNLEKGASDNLSAMIVANWADLFILQWSGLEIKVDPYTGMASGTYKLYGGIRANTFVRRKDSFIAMRDIKAL